MAEKQLGGGNPDSKEKHGGHYGEGVQTLKVYGVGSVAESEFREALKI